MPGGVFGTVGAEGWVAILANPSSGSGPNRRRVEGLARALERRSVTPRIFWRPAEEIEELGSPALMDSCRAIVAAGGDGTINRVIGRPLHAPLAVLPLGTENLFAKHYGFTRDPEPLAAAIVRGETRSIDIGTAGDRAFSLVVSAGFDGEVAHRLDRWRAEKESLKRVRHASYVGPIVGTIWRYRYPEVVLEVDGERHRGTLAMVYNMPAYALGMSLAPDARDDDGRLDWVVFRGRGVVALADLAVDIVRGSHRHRGDICYGRAQSLRITSAEPVAVQLDGEAAGTTPLDIGIRPRALTIVVP